MAIVKRKNKNGSITYQVKVKDSVGRWFPTPGFRSLSEANIEESRLLELKEKGGHAISHDARTTTVREYWDVWSVENRTEVSEGWKISEKQMYRDYVDGPIGKVKMADVTAPMIGSLLKSMKDQGLSDQMRKHVYSLCRKMFLDAVEYYEMLGKSPVKPKFHRPKVATKQPEFLTPDGARILLEESRKIPARGSYLGPAVWLQTLASLRAEAALPLAFFQIHWDRDQILICRAWKEKVRKLEEFPKGDSWEYVPMPPPLKEYLRELYEKAGRDDQAFVCKSLKGKMLPYNTYLQGLKRLCRRLGLSEIATHGARHTSTELYVEVGASLEDLRRLLTHKHSSTTERYVHKTGSRLSAIASRVRADLRVIPGGEQHLSFPESFPNGKEQSYAASKGDEAEAM